MRPYHLTPSEEYRLHGSVSAETMEQLIESFEEYEEVLEILPHFADIDDLRSKIEALEAREEKPADYAEYVGFFYDCVASLNSGWPWASVVDQNLRHAICEAITRGDVEESNE